MEAMAEKLAGGLGKRTSVIWMRWTFGVFSVPMGCPQLAKDKNRFRKDKQG